MLDYLRVSVFDAAACEEMITELRSIAGAAATVYGKETEATIDPAIRKATRLTATGATRERILAHILEQKRALENHFGLQLGDLEEPQFLRYVSGDYFVAHQDGNTPLTLDDTRFRRVSIIVFLNSADTFGGGTLVFHGAFPDLDRREQVPAVAGTMIAFRSETTHEVTPLLHGERYTVVSWFDAA